MTIKNPCLRVVMAVVLGLVVGDVSFTPAAYAAQTTKKSYELKGKIEKIDTKAKTITVNGENVQGWMPAMTMSYGLDKEDVIGHVKVGDEITAKVYEGDFKTLYDVKVVPPKAPETPKK